MIREHTLRWQTSCIFLLLVNPSVALDKVCYLISYSAVFDKEAAVATRLPQAASFVITPLHTHQNYYPRSLPLFHVQLQHKLVLEALCLATK